MLYTIMGTDPDSMACNGLFLKCTSHMCIQFQQPLFIDQNAIAGIPGTEKIEMKLKTCIPGISFPIEHHLQLFCRWKLSAFPHD